MPSHLADIELLLTAVGAIERSSVPGAPNFADGPGKDDSGNDSDQEGGKRRTIRSKTQEEEDAELDWDL